MRRSRSRSAIYSEPGGGADFSSEVRPNGVPGLLAWHRGDHTTRVSGNISAAADLSNNGHELTQSTAGNRPPYSASGLNGQPAFEFGPTASDKFMSWSDWAAPAKCTILAWLKFRDAGANFQVFVYRDGQATPYLQSNVDRKPMIYTNNPFASWSANLVDGSTHLISWATDADIEQCRTRVDGSVEVSQTSGVAFAPGTFKTLGFDPGVSATQDLIALVGELRIYDHLLSSPEHAVLRAYGQTRYGTP